MKYISQWVIIIIIVKEPLKTIINFYYIFDFSLVPTSDIPEASEVKITFKIKSDFCHNLILFIPIIVPQAISRH